MLPALGFILVGIIGIFAGKFFKKFAQQQQAKLDEKKQQKLEKENPLDN